MISYSGETGEDNFKATLATGTSLRNNVHQYGGKEGSNTSKKENTNKGSRDNNSAIKPELATVETYKFRYFLTSICSSTRQSSFGL